MLSCFIVGLNCHADVFAQQQIHFNHLPDDNLLAKEHIRDIHQDKEGLLWFGTRNGLVKFDGYEYTVFSNFTTDSTSLSNDFVYCIWEDIEKPVLWIGSQNGLSRFDQLTEQFKNYTFSPSDSTGLLHPFVPTVIQSADGQIWLGTEGGGLHQFDPDTESFTHFFPDGSKRYPWNRIDQLLEDPEGYIWGSTMGGVFRLDRKTGGFQLFPLNIGNVLLNAGLAMDRRGQIYATSKDGLFIYDPDKNDFRLLPLDYPRLKQQLDNINWPEFGGTFTLYVDHKHRLWMGVQGKDFALRIDLNTLEETVFKHDPSIKTSLGSTQVQTFMEDRDGRLWIGRWIGLSYMDPYIQKFNVIYPKISPSINRSMSVVTGVWKDRKGYLWMAAAGKGLTKYNLKIGTQELFYGEDLTDPKYVITAAYPYSEELIWLNGWGGTFAFNVEKKKYIDFPKINGFSGKPDAFKLIDKQTMLLTRQGQLSYLNLSTGVLDVMPSHILQLGQHFNHVIKDSKGFIWMFVRNQGERSLVRYLPGTSIYYQYRGEIVRYLSEDSSCTIFDFKEDRNGDFWMCCNGLYRLELVGEDSIAVKRWQKENSALVSNAIYTIEEDRKSNIWLTTEMGITRFDPEAESFTFWGTEACGQRFFLMSLESFQDEAGWLYYSGKSGVTWLHPDSIPINTNPPKVILTDFRIDNQRVPIQGTRGDTLEDGNPLSLPIRFTDELTLDYAQNDFSFTFAALDYSQPEKNRYAYKLENYHDDWIETDARQRTANFTNIPAGRYVFLVKAANPDGVWNETGTSVAITILKPWWQTFWARGALVLAILFVLYLIRRFEMRKQQKKLEREQAFNRQLQTINRANQKFVPNDFLHILGKESITELQLGDQTQAKMTVLFADIRNYTGLSETMSPDDNFKFINGFLGRMGPIIQKHRGFICQYFGDGIMALFKDRHDMAVKAAIEMQQAIGLYNEERVKAGRVPIKAGIGLNTGQLMLGVIGDKNRYDSSVISDAVNTASRMEGLTKIFGGTVIFSEKTLAELKSGTLGDDHEEEDSERSIFAYRYLGKIKVKGRDAAIRIYDCFAGEPEAIRYLKTETKAEFEKAIGYYFNRQFGKAADLLKEVLKKHPKDKAASFYFEKSKALIINGVEKDWNGVEEMVMK